MNIAIVQGTVRAQPDHREGAAGDTIVSFDVKTTDTQGRSHTVPVSWIGPQGRQPSVSVDSVVTVIGQVRRRFYRAGGATTSRTDILAERVVKGAGVRAQRAIKQALVSIVKPDIG